MASKAKKVNKLKGKNFSCKQCGKKGFKSPGAVRSHYVTSHNRDFSQRTAAITRSSLPTRKKVAIRQVRRVKQLVSSNEWNFCPKCGHGLAS